MKLLLVINSFATGGAEKLLLESIPIFFEKGIDIHLLLLNGSTHPFLDALKEKNCCTIHSLGKGSVYNPIHIIKIIPFLKQFDIVHVHLFPSLYWVSIAHFISFSKSKLIYTEHSTKNNRRNKLFFKWIDRLIYKRYTFIVAISKQVFENISKHLIYHNSKKYKVVQNGINLKRIKNANPYFKSKFFENPNVKIIIMVARFYEPKDHNTVINAIQLLPENIVLILVGDGILKNESIKLVEKLNIKNRVLFLDNRNDVEILIKTADIVVLSSRYEGLSLSCIEGMASGKPFVASEVPGLKEVVENAGVLFPYGDEKALAAILLQLLDNEEFYANTVASCLRKASEFDIFKMVDEYIYLYNLDER